MRPRLFLLQFVLCLGLAAAGVRISPAAELVDLARAARPAVVQLLIYDRTGEVVGSGTGFFIDANGRMLTNWHVVEGATKVEAQLADGRKVPVSGLLAEDMLNDLALIQCAFKPPAGSWLVLAPAGTEGVEPGQRVFVIGAPRGMSGTVSEGIVSAVRTAKDFEQFFKYDRKKRGDFIQVTAPISPGSSGSPVLDTNGRVIAVAAALLGGGQNLNFAVPMGAVHKLLAELPETPKIRGFGAVTQGPNAGRNLLISAAVLLVVGLIFRYLMRPSARPRGGRGRG